MGDSGLEKHVFASCLFHDKLGALDFTPDRRLPDKYQVALDCYYGILFNPFVACQAAEYFLGFDGPKHKGYAMSVIFQASLLHPFLLPPAETIKTPFDEVYLLADAKPYMYAIGRLLLLGVCGVGASSGKLSKEIELLFDAVRPQDAEVYKALASREFEALPELKAKIIEDPGMVPYYDHWWNRFFDIYFEKREVFATV